VAPALGACMPGKADAHGMKMGAAHKPSAAMPCDAPCKDCAPDAVKKSCGGECVCLPMIIAMPPVDPLPRVTPGRVEIARFIARIPLHHPRDTPPPRSFA